jgi:type 1 glutamine amidotransferase
MRKWPLILCALLVALSLPSAGAEKPPPRTRAEVAAVLGAKPAPASAKPLRICLVASKQDHGPGEHDYPAWQTNWTKLLGKAPRVTVTTAWKWPEAFTNVDVAVFYFWNHDWSAERYQQLDEFLARGGGAVMLHSATIADKDPEKLAERIGLAFQPGRSKYRHGPLDLKIVAAADEPITRALPREIHFVDESYWPMIGDTNSVRVLATAKEEGKDWPMVWTLNRGKGKVFASIVGHYAWSYDDPLFRLMVLRAIAWAANEPIGRLEGLATEGVKLAD